MDHVPPADRVEAAACGLCHFDVYRQWRGSLHAGAFSPGLAGRLAMHADVDAASCLRCHAPREEQRQDWTEAKDDGAYRHGIDCAACHLRRHRRHGPRNLQTVPHGGVVGHEDFGRSLFCSPCHQFAEDDAQINGKPLENTYQEWLESDYATVGTTCQSCHMPDGRHEFRGIHDPELTRTALAIEVLRTDRGVTVDLHNQGAGHHLPTYGTPRISIRIESTLSEPFTTRVHHIQRSLDWDPDSGWIEHFDTRLAAGARTQMTMDLGPDQGARVEVVVEPDFDYTDRVYPRLLRLPESILPEAARHEIKAALQLGQARRYVLAAHICPPVDAAPRQCPDSEVGPSE